jgi:two-component system, sensor histidine kinase and response regulator
MNAVMGMTDLALRTRLTPRQREYIRTANDSAEALLTILNDILDVSKIEAGRLALDQAPFSLRDAVEDAVRLFAARAAAKRLELACHIRPEVPDALVGDPGRLRQVLVNLVGNAIKFTQAGDVIVEVQARGVTDAEAVLEFGISDTGIGIAPDKQWRIFGAFVQADSSTTRRFGGTGLGLTISADLVEMMGGRIWVTSEEGRGSQFRFTATFGIQPQPLQPSPPNAANLRELRALVVDDNAANRTILQELRASWRMDATAVASAAAALAALDEAIQQQRPFDLVITDALMPEVDGFALARQIAADARLSGARVIMLTSAGPSSARHRGADRTIASQLTKPVKQSDLLDAIVTACGTPAGPLPEDHEIPRPRRTAGRRLNILVAEDNPTNQTLVRLLLEQDRHRVTLVPDGRQAVMKAEIRAFDLILMDVQMPEMDGFEATAAIRQRERSTGAHVPIVAMTAHAMAGDRKRCLEHGMDAYISKPLRPEELMATIDGLFAPEHSRSSIDGPTLVAEFGHNPTVLAEVIRVFLSDAPGQAAALRAAIESAEADSIAAAAHALKGSIGLLSTGPAYEAARGLEQAARTGDLTAIDARYSAVHDELSRVCADLEALLTKLV